MPAWRERSTRYRAGVRNPSRLEPIDRVHANGGNRRVSLVVAHSGDRLLSEPIAGTQLCRREPLFMPLKRPCRRDRGTAQVGGKEAFPILPAYDPKASKAVIHCLKPRHPTVRLFQRYRW